MLLSSSAAYDLTATAPAAPTSAEAVETPAQLPATTDAASDVAGHVAGIRAPLGIAIVTTAGTGVAVAVGGAIWAVLVDVPFPIAIMAGYCTLAGAFCMTAALRLTAARGASAAPVVSGPTTNYAAWRLVQKFSVSDASRLWCDLEPGASATQESIAWARVLLDAISRSELPMVEKAGMRKEAIDYERNNPSWHTEVTRNALATWATSHGFDPRFLRD